MALPPPEKLQELNQICNKEVWSKRGKYGTADAVKDWLKKYLTMAGTAAAQSALQHGVTAASGVATVTVGVGIASVALFPLGAALGPWLAALAVGAKADGIFRLYDLKEQATKNGGYTCSCGKCVAGLQYVIDKKETFVAVVAVSPFLAALPIIANRVHSVIKSFEPNRPKERISRQFVDSAKGSCICAIASIMMLCGDWKQDEAPNKELMIEAISIMVADDGWRKLKSKW